MPGADRHHAFAVAFGHQLLGLAINHTNRDALIYTEPDSQGGVFSPLYPMQQHSYRHFESVRFVR